MPFVVERDGRYWGPFEDPVAATHWAQSHLPEDGKPWAVRPITVIAPNMDLWEPAMYKGFHIAAVVICALSVWNSILTCLPFQVHPMLALIAGITIAAVAAKSP
jgi:hypothetical protein